MNDAAARLHFFATGLTEYSRQGNSGRPAPSFADLPASVMPLAPTQHRA